VDPRESLDVVGKRLWRVPTTLTGYNRSSLRKTCLSVNVPTTNPTQTGMLSNPSLRGERPETNRLNRGTVPSSLNRP
jgi:hypothetical protein